DEGRLTSGKGETVSFSECVILMTSNIGGRQLADTTLAETFAREEAEAELKAHFRPEFLNRLDDIIYFHLLSEEDLRQILDLMLTKEFKRLAERKISLDLTQSAKTWLLAQNEHPEWGARPLRRIIQEHIRAPMADFLLEQDPQAGLTVRVDAADGRLTFEVA
ncbi:MAG: AAA family ATPase, partial [Anaerolineae bacterium]